MAKNRSRGSIGGGLVGSAPDQADGYTANGESQFTRYAAQNGKRIYLRTQEAITEYKSKPELIRSYESDIRKLRGKMLDTQDMEKRATIRESIAIKERRLIELKVESRVRPC